MKLFYLISLIFLLYSCNKSIITLETYEKTDIIENEEHESTDWENEYEDFPGQEVDSSRKVFSDGLIREDLNLIRDPLPEPSESQDRPVSIEERTKNKVKNSTQDQNVNDIKYGNLVYDIPDTMQVGKVYLIRIRINRDTTDKSIGSGLSDRSSQTQIRTTYRMEVSIVDPGEGSNKYFNITKSTGDIQILENEGYTEWVYGITPLKSGRHKLNLVISIIKGSDLKQIVYLDEVWVKSNPVSTIKKGWNDNWKWWMTTVIIPIFIWLYNRKKKKEKQE